MTTRVGAAIGVLAGLLLTSCGGLPTPDDVRVVRPVTADERRADVELRRIPAAPQVGQTAEEVVQGFLAAGADLEVARRYLAVGTAWQPLRALVFEDAPAVVVAATDAAAVSTSATVRLDPVLEIAEDGASRPVIVAPAPLTLSLVRSAATGEWRISALPDVLPLRARDLAQTRRAATLAWLTPGRRGLFRDPVLLPGSRDQLLSAAVTQLLAGPSSRLVAAGVTTALPPGTRANRVTPVGDGVEVDLDPTAQAADPSQTALARAQLAATLLSLPGVNRVRVLVEGQPLLPPGVRDDGVLTAADVAAVLATTGGGEAAPEALVAAGGRVQPLQGGSPPAPPTPLTALAVGADGQATASLLRLPGGLVAPQVAPSRRDTPVTVGEPGAWTSLAWSPDGALWLVRGGQVLLRPRDGGALRPVTGVRLEGMPVAMGRLLVAPDGVHLVGVTGDGRLVAGLAVSAAAAVTDLHEVAPGLRGVELLALATQEGRVVATGRLGTARPDSRPRVWRVDVAAPDPSASGDDLTGALFALSAPCPVGTTASLGGRPGQPTLAGCADGTVRRLTGTTWEAAGGGRLPTWSGG